jgi:hypothetical protein
MLGHLVFLLDEKKKKSLASQRAWASFLLG